MVLPKCPTSTPLTTLVGRIGVGHTPKMRVCPTTSGARRLTGPMSVGHFGELGARSWETLVSGESGFAKVQEDAAGVG